MALEKIKKVVGRCVAVPGDDIDTDRIIPARYMKCVTFDGLGEFMFYDVRLDAQGNKKEHPLNDPKFAGASILLSGNNFGCGSSREHAPQAIYRAGFRAVVAEGYAEIFFGNSTTLGMPCVCASREEIARLRTIIEQDPQATAQIDLEAMQIRVGSTCIPITMRESARTVLIEGKWDAIGDLLEGLDEVDQVAAQLPYMRAA